MVNQEISGKTIRQYLARFTEELNKVDRFDDNHAITAIIEGLRTSDFLKSVVNRVPSTMAELMNRAKTFMGIKDYLDGRKRNNQNSRRRDEPSHEQGNSRKKQNKGGQASSSQPLTSQKPRLTKNFKGYTSFTPLNTTSDRILDLARDKFTAATPMKKDSATRDRSRYCEFYQEYGHMTSECFNLKRQIEVLG